MSEYTVWLQANDRYLAQAMAGLRARLLRLAGQAVDPVEAASQQREATPPSLSTSSLSTSSVSAPVVSAPVVSASTGSTSSTPPQGWLDRWFGDRSPQAGSSPAASVVAAVADAPPVAVDVSAPTPHEESPAPVPALQLLANRLGLSDFERDLLLLCIGMELDTQWPALCAQAQHDPSKPWPTFALAFAALDGASWDALSPQRPLRYWRLLDIHQPGPQPLMGAALSADERVVNFVKGLNHLDDRLAPLLTPLASSALPPSQQAVADRVLESLRHVPAGQPLPLVQLLGTDSASKQAIACFVADAFDAQVYRWPAELVPHGIAEQETLSRLWLREAQLQPVGLYLDASELDHGDAASAPIRRFLARHGGLTFVDIREPWPGMAAHALSADVAKPTPMEQRSLWQHLLGAAAEGHPRLLAGHFDFGPGKIEQIAQTALSATTGKAGALSQSLWQGALARTRPALDQLAQRIETQAGWDDLKLPDNEKELLRQIADQVAQRAVVYDDWGFRERMSRGMSISALFAGESGTGKTMAAEVIANTLGLSLYRIDLSAVVSKYIGETEKNLRKLFDAADDGGAILFFDEADALFGRRSEVKDSHDRYANIEVNYLLQRLESFRGLAILATNMKGALDSAFMRRIRFIVNFPFPGQAERKAIWASAFPPQIVTGALDLERLARLALSGGSIHGIALNAAFLAAKAGAQITMPLILQAARNEFRKLDKPVNEADFRWLEPAGAAP